MENEKDYFCQYNYFWHKHVFEKIFLKNCLYVIGNGKLK